MTNLLKKHCRLRAFSLPELLVVLVIIGILVLVALPNLMPLISRAKATKAQQQLTFLHSLEQSYFYTYSRYSDDLSVLGFEQSQFVTEGGNANYRIEVISADEKGFKAQAVSVVDFDKDGLRWRKFQVLSILLSIIPERESFLKSN